MKMLPHVPATDPSIGHRFKEVPAQALMSSVRSESDSYTNSSAAAHPQAQTSAPSRTPHCASHQEH